MAYTTAANVKTYLGIGVEGDDTLITSLISRATKWVENYTGRVFESTGSTTRRFTVGTHTDGPLLFFDEDCVSISTVTNLADAATTETISSSEYVTLPRNFGPYYGIRILDSSDKSWDYADDPEMGITVAGNWAYSTTPPADIVHAVIRLTGYLYRQKDAQVFDVTTIPDAGVIQTPVGIPADVKMILEPYRRRAEIV